MSDGTIQTTNFSFQRIGDGSSRTVTRTGKGSEVLEPQDYNGLLDALDAQLPSNPDTATTHTAKNGAAVTNIKNVSGFQMLRLTLTNAAITVTNANKYGSVEIFDWANTNVIVLDARMDLTVVKDGTGILTADTPNIGVGSAAASNTTLATTMIDTINKVATAGAALSEAAQQHGAATPDIRYIAAGASNKLYLNAGATGNSGAADGSLTVSGTIDIFYANTGTFS